jgi:hypothetical protein
MHIPEDPNAVHNYNHPVTIILAGPNLEDRGPENYAQGKGRNCMGTDTAKVSSVCAGGSGGGTGRGDARGSKNREKGVGGEKIWDWLVECFQGCIVITHGFERTDRTAADAKCPSNCLLDLHTSSFSQILALLPPRHCHGLLSAVLQFNPNHSPSVEQPCIFQYCLF